MRMAAGTGAPGLTSSAHNAAIGAAGDGLTRVIDEALNGMACAPDALPTGFGDLDETLGGGLRRGQLTVVAGLPGVGPSVLALGLARAAALRHGLPTLFMAPDSSQREILCRVVAAEAAVPVSHVRAGRVAAGDTEKLRRFQSRVHEAPLILSAGWLAPAPVPLDEAVGDYARTVGVAVVDATPDDADVVRSLKIVAQRFDIVLVVTVKTGLVHPPLDRTVRPRLADLRGPANLAELADLVIALHRDDMFDPRSKRPGEADLEILKHRYGPTRELPPVAFQGHYARFVEIRT